MFLFISEKETNLNKIRFYTYLIMEMWAHFISIGKIEIRGSAVHEISFRIVTEKTIDANNTITFVVMYKFITNT